MVTRDTAWPDGTPCWVDLGVDDIAKASTFYAGLFGWDIQAGPPEAGGYTMCLKNGRAVAGIGPSQGPPGTPPVWTTYLAADDADQTAAKVTKAGGQMFMEPFDVLDVGRMAVAADPGGAAFGIWQARAHTGAGLANEPGTLCWNENHTRDFDRNKAFYQAAFGYAMAWFLLLGGVRPVLELQRSRRRRRGGQSDADQLARLTGVAAGAWVLLFAVVSLGALAVSGYWLVA